MNGGARVARVARVVTALATGTMLLGALGACAAAGAPASESVMSPVAATDDRERTMKSSDESVADGASVERSPIEITAIALQGDGIVVDVVSTGCTTPASVAARVERLDERTVALTLLRVRPDGCRRMPMNKRLELDRETLGIGPDDDIVLRNPLGRLPGRGRGG